MKKIYDIFLEAINNNKLIQFLNCEIEIPDTSHSIENIGKKYDWTVLLPDTIYEVYKKRPELNISMKFEESLILMAKMGKQSFINSLSIFFTQLIGEELNISPFSINRNRILNVLNNQIKNETFNSLELEEIERIQKTLFKRYNINLELK